MLLQLFTNNNTAQFVYIVCTVYVHVYTVQWASFWGASIRYFVVDSAVMKISTHANNGYQSVYVHKC